MHKAVFILILIYRKGEKGPMKRKKTFRNLLSLFFLLFTSSCSHLVSYALDFNVVVDEASSSLSLINYYDQFGKEIRIVKEEEALSSFLNDRQEVIITDVFKGLRLIKEKHVPYELKCLNTWGNLYLLGKNDKTLENMQREDRIVSAQEGTTGNRLFLYAEEKAGNITYYSSSEEEYGFLIKDNDFDYVLLKEPYVTKLLSKDNSPYHYLASVSALFKKKSVSEGITSSGYAHYPETGLFVSTGWKNADKEKQKKYENFLDNYQRLLNNLGRTEGGTAVDILYNAESNYGFNVRGTFSVDTDMLSLILRGQGKTGETNPFGYCSYNADVVSFYTNLSLHGLDLL